MIDTMLTGLQQARVWQLKLEADARSLYYAEVASKESTIKRWITGGTFVLGSAVLVTLLGEAPKWMSVCVTLVITVANGYQIAINQESKIKAASKLHLAWRSVECDYDNLWSHQWDADAEATFRKLQEREQDLSEMAVTEVGLNKKRWEHWWSITCNKYASDHATSNTTTTTAQTEPRHKP